jgi:hypothetical protein
MSEMYMLRRANGDFFAEEVGGRLSIPVWPSREAVARYKERNPELIFFSPARADRDLMKRLTGGPGREAADFFLLSGSAPDAYLKDGKPISLEEVFREDEIASKPAGAKADRAPKQGPANRT